MISISISISKIHGTLLVMAMTAVSAGAAGLRLASPDATLSVTISAPDDQGAVTYQVEKNGEVVLLPSKLGIVRADADFTRGMKWLGESTEEKVEDRYEILTGKRRQNFYQANRRVVYLEGTTGKKLDLEFQVSNDGLAFRYHFPEKSGEIHEIKEERTGFKFAEETRAWLQPIAEAQSGWEKANPSYEEYHTHGSPIGEPSPTGAGWVYPALFRIGKNWVLLSESGLGRDYCGTRLRHDSTGGEYLVGLADPRETGFSLPAHPRGKLPWTTPWRLMVVGSLKTIVESSLGTDLARPAIRPAIRPADSSVVPGKAAWSWALLKDEATVFETQKKFVDYAADMKWKYCLVDALWDTQIGWEKLKELCDYAKSKDVKILVWYNSAGDWNTAPQTPRSQLLTPADRARQFQKLKETGVAGLKIDFFGGDGQPMIGYYLDLLEEAEPFGFLMNFHGCTLPRGWQRTYPHLMTMESARGLEYITFEQENADRAPEHMAMMPFTRNVFDPMDFTPVVLDTIPKIERRTTSGFELATAVIFTSGIQHYAEIPEGMEKAPAEVRDYLRQVPAVWDDVRFLDGEPGKYCVLARRGNGKWHIAGINAMDQEIKIRFDITTLGGDAMGLLMTDDPKGKLGLSAEILKPAADGVFQMTFKPKGGFVLVR